MFDRLFRPAMVAAACGLACVSQVHAQDEGGDEMTAQEAAPVDGVSYFAPWEPSWSSSQIERLSESLIGAWKTTSPVPQRGDSGESTEIMLLIHPVPVEGLPDALYSEAYRLDNPSQPYRQSVMQFYTYKGEPRLRTFELAMGAVDEGSQGRKPANPYGVFAGMGLAPEAFPQLSSDELIATLDQVVKPSGNGFKGETPQPYPTDLFGAVLMTSEMTVKGDRMTVSDRGYAADGSVAWGASSSGSFEFRKTEPHITVERQDNNLIVLNFNKPEGDIIDEGGKLFVDYMGWLEDGYVFDTSRQEGRDVFGFAYPPRLIEGWNTGLDGVSEGSLRKLVMPSDLGYSNRGQPRASIPPNAPLYFDIEIRAIQSAAEIEAEQARADEKAAEAEGATEGDGDENH